MEKSPKYRRLTLEELEPLQKEFIDFLVVNGILADDWIKMKAQTPEKAEKLIDLFSDVVFETMLRKIEFIELRTGKHLFCCQCTSEKLVLFGIEGDDSYSLSEASQSWTAGKMPDLQIISSEKRYRKHRESELFEMLQEGYQISDGRLFKALALAYAAQ